MNRGQRHRLDRVASTRPSASGRRSPRATAAYTEQVDHPRRRGPRGQRHRRRRAPAPQLSRTTAARWASRGLRVHPRHGPRGQRRARSRARRVELLSAPPLPAGTRTILLHPSQLYMQVHESCGHPTELDRAFGTEASYAGTSFLTPDMLGELPLRLGPVRHRRRRDRRRRPRHVRLGRRGRRRAARADSSRRACSSAT